MNKGITGMEQHEGAL